MKDLRKMEVKPRATVPLVGRLQASRAGDTKGDPMHNKSDVIVRIKDEEPLTHGQYADAIAAGRWYREMALRAEEEERRQLLALLRRPQDLK
jgi:hypothetical protein